MAVTGQQFGGGNGKVGFYGDAVGISILVLETTTYEVEGRKQTLWRRIWWCIWQRDCGDCKSDLCEGSMKLHC